MGDLEAKLFLLFTVVFWGISGAFQKLAVNTMNGPTVQLMSSFVICITVILYYALTGQLKFGPYNSHGLTYTALAALASAGGSIAFISLLKGREVSSVIGYAGCYPLVTFLIAILFLGESFNVSRLIGICIVLFGISLMGR